MESTDKETKNMYSELSKKLTNDINKKDKKIMVFILHHQKQ